MERSIPICYFALQTVEKKDVRFIIFEAGCYQILPCGRVS